MGCGFHGPVRLDSDGRLVLKGKFDKSLNGVVLSPDEKTLYLALILGNEVLTFDTSIDGATSNLRTFATPSNRMGWR